MDNISTDESKEFYTLLDWLSEDREKAGTEYIKIRDGLMRFFRFKGCSDTQTLADDTLDRVAKRIHTFDESNDVKKTTIIYGFANKIALEYLRKKKREREKLNDSGLIKNVFEPYEEENEVRLDCMNFCLSELSDEDRAIFITYFGQSESVKKSEARKELAESLNCEMNALHVRVFRIRKVLMNCIEKCVKKSL